MFKMQSVKGPVHVKIYLGHKIAVVNEGTVPVVLKAGTLVMAFGKITYRKLGTNEAPNLDKEPIWKTDKTASFLVTRLCLKRFSLPHLRAGRWISPRAVPPSPTPVDGRRGCHCGVAQAGRFPGQLGLRWDNVVFSFVWGRGGKATTTNCSRPEGSPNKWPVTQTYIYSRGIVRFNKNTRACLSGIPLVFRTKTLPGGLCAQELLYTLSGSDDCVQFQSGVQTVGQALEDRRKINPDPKVCAWE